MPYPEGQGAEDPPVEPLHEQDRPRQAGCEDSTSSLLATPRREMGGLLPRVTLWSRGRSRQRWRRPVQRSSPRSSRTPTVRPRWQCDVHQPGPPVALGWGAFPSCDAQAIRKSHCRICDGRTAVLVGEGLNLGLAELRPEYTANWKSRRPSSLDQP